MNPMKASCEGSDSSNNAENMPRGNKVFIISNTLISRGAAVPEQQTSSIPGRRAGTAPKSIMIPRMAPLPQTVTASSAMSGDLGLPTAPTDAVTAPPMMYPSTSIYPVGQDLAASAPIEAPPFFIDPVAPPLARSIFFHDEDLMIGTERVSWKFSVNFINTGFKEELPLEYTLRNHIQTLINKKVRSEELCNRLKAYLNSKVLQDIVYFLESEGARSINPVRGVPWSPDFLSSTKSPILPNTESLGQIPQEYGVDCPLASSPLPFNMPVMSPLNMTRTPYVPIWNTAQDWPNNELSIFEELQGQYPNATATSNEPQQQLPLELQQQQLLELQQQQQQQLLELQQQQQHQLFELQQPQQFPFELPQQHQLPSELQQHPQNNQEEFENKTLPMSKKKYSMAVNMMDKARELQKREAMELRRQNADITAPGVTESRTLKRKGCGDRPAGPATSMITTQPIDGHSRFTRNRFNTSQPAGCPGPSTRPSSYSSFRPSSGPLPPTFNSQATDDPGLSASTSTSRPITQAMVAENNLHEPGADSALAVPAPPLQHRLVFLHRNGETGRAFLLYCALSLVKKSDE